jgi:hypothetical protein
MFTNESSPSFQGGRRPFALRRVFLPDAGQKPARAVGSPLDANGQQERLQRVSTTSMRV